MKEKDRNVFNLPYPIDCLETFKISNSQNSGIDIGIISGMYKHLQVEQNFIEDTSQKIKRIGGVALFTFQIDKVESSEETNYNIDSISTLMKLNNEIIFKMDYGILDLHLLQDDYNSQMQGSLFCICSDCNLRQFTLIKENDSFTLNLKNSVSPQTVNKNSHSIGLAMDIFKSQNINKQAFSCSDGSLTVVEDSKISNHWVAHDMETWTVCFDKCHDGNTILTGADDCTVKFWDLRTDLKYSYANIKKIHPMGVTSLSFCPYNPYILFSGCYDENIRIWDTRALNSPVDVLKSSGGIWRLKFRDDYLLVAACDGGAEIWKRSNNFMEHERIHIHKGHSSLVYGIDLLSNHLNYRSLNNNKLAASCSFYDKEMHIWPF